MQEERVGKRFTRYMTLSVLSMIGLAAYYLTDTFFISNKVGALGLAALNFSIPVYGVLSGLGLLLGVGGATMFTIHKSRNEQEQGNCVYTNMIVLGTLISILGVLLGWLGAEAVASLMGAIESTGVVREMTVTYLRILLTFTPCFIYNNILIAFMRNDDAPRFSTICMVAGTLTNIVLDYIFIYPMDMGMLGASLATGISPLVGLVMAMVIYVLPKKATFHLCRCKLSPKLMLWCCALGTSSFIGEISTSVVVTVSNLVIFNLTGDIGVAAYSVIANFTFVVIAIFTGIIQGAQPLLSDYYARNMYKEEQQTMRLCMISSIVLGVFWWGFGLLFAPQITAIFNSEQNAMLAAIAIPGIRIYFSGFVLAGINMAFSGVFAALEQPRQSMIISLSRGMVVVVFFVLLLSRMWGMTGVWLSSPATEIVTFVLALVLYGRFVHKRKTAEKV